MVSDTPTDRKVSWSTDSNSAKPVTFEVLEPRILLSGDSLLNIAPDPFDSLIDTTPQVVQYAELLETNDQIEEEINQELDPAEALNSDIYQPIFTLSVNEGNIAPVEADNNVTEPSGAYGKNIDNKIIVF